MYHIDLHELDTITDIKTFISSLKNNKKIEVSFSYESNFQNAKVLRDIVDRICTEMGMSSKWKTRMVLIVDEMNNNAIEYGSKAGDINELYMCLQEEETRLSINIVVKDAGTGEHTKTAMEMEKLRSQRIAKGFSNHNSIRGRGLFMIISNLVDELYFEDNLDT